MKRQFLTQPVKEAGSNIIMMPKAKGNPRQAALLFEMRRTQLQAAEATVETEVESPTPEESTGPKDPQGNWDNYNQFLVNLA